MNIPAENIKTEELKIEAETIEIKETEELNIPANDPVDIIEVDEKVEANIMAPVELDEESLAEVPKPNMAELEESDPQNIAQKLNLDPEKIDTLGQKLSDDEKTMGSVLMTEEKKNEIAVDEIMTEVTHADELASEIEEDTVSLKIVEIPAVLENEVAESEALDQSVVEEKTEEDLASIMPAAVENVIQSVQEEITPETDAHRTEPSNEIRLWTAKNGQNLKALIEEWSTQENIHLVWNAPDDYEISKKTIINGTFKNAVDVLLTQGVKNAPKYSVAQTPEYEIRVDVN